MMEIQTIVNALMKKAEQARDSSDALRFSQAALNVAHAKHALGELNEST